MSIVSPGAEIACRVAVPEPYATRARYALEVLLVPLGLNPVWSGPPRITYGEGDAPGALRLDYAPEAAGFFSGPLRTYDASSAHAFEWDGERWPGLFRAADGRIDLVGSTFLYVSGWHEAASTSRDEHGRVPFDATLPGLLDTADRPVVDAYRLSLADDLRAAGIEVRPRRWAGRTWALCPTHDIDYVRKGRPGIWWREVVHHLLQNRRGSPVPARLRRFGAFLGQMAGRDPFRIAFERMIDEVAARGGTATYFMKAGAADPHDVPYSLDSLQVHARLEELRERGFEVGLHPSYRTPDDAAMLDAERDRLQEAVEDAVRSVRQHYLRYDPASTPRMHAEAGFEVDSTLGFADRCGFRRGTCLPFRLYDLESDRPLDLLEVPLTIMESALFNRQGLSTEDAVASTEAMLATCRRFGGVCVALWHNTLWDEIDCPGWGEHFTRTLDAAVREEALVASLEDGLRGWG